MKDKVVVVQLLAIVVVNEFPLYSPTASCTEDMFFSKLVQHVTYKAKNIYGASAEVIGMSLHHYVSQNNVATEKKLVELITPVMNKLQATEPGRFLVVLKSIQKHYTALAQRFHKKLLFMLPNLYSEFQLTCLEILSQQVPVIENAFVEFKTRNILGFLTHRNSVVQLASLHVVQQMLPSLTPEELDYLLPTVTSLLKSQVLAVRKAVYEICNDIYKTYKANDNETGQKLHTTAKKTLLVGLGDCDFGLKLMNITFWIKEIGHSESIMERAVSVINSLYSPNTEHMFLSYATYILLENTSQSPDFGRNIFPYPLSECQFTDYPINPSWTERHSGINSQLFVDSAYSQIDGPGEVLGSQKLRVTQQTAAFSATQQVGATNEKTFNWMTQATVDVASSTLPVKAASESSLYCFEQNSRFHYKDDQKKGAASYVPSALQMAMPQPSTSQDFKRPTARDDQGIRDYFARKNILKQAQDEKNEIIARKKQESEVTLYRKYRKGDLPDIEIPYSAVIIPLQALAERDKVVAKILFSNLMRGIVVETSNAKSPAEMGTIYELLSDYLNNILRDSTMYSPSLIGSILHIAFDFCNKFKLSLESLNLVTACIASNQESLGILLLEEYIRNGDGDTQQKPSKRARKIRPELSTDLETWIKLSELYKSMGNYDVVRGIFELRLGFKDSIQLALQAESRKDYIGALRHYSEVMSSLEEQEMIPEEYDYYDDAMMKCFNNLTQWKELEIHTLNRFTDSEAPQLAQIWDDSYHQEHHLPYLLRSKVKQFLDGRDDKHLTRFIDEALTDHNQPHKAALLESRHAQDICVLLIVQEAYDEASHYLSLAINTYLQDWVSKPNQFTIAQKYNIQKLQSLADMHSFLTAVKHKGSKYPYTYKHLLSTWKRCLPNVLDSVSTWDDVVMNRHLYIDRLSQLQQQSAFEHRGSEPSVFVMNEDDVKLSMSLAYVQSMINQENVQVALKHLQKSRSMINKVRKPSSEIEWTHAYVGAHHQQFQNQLGKVEADRVLNTWKQLNKLDNMEFLKQNAAQMSAHCMLHARLAEIISSVVERNPGAIKSLKPNNIKILEQNLGEADIDASEMPECLQKLFITKVKEGISSSEGCDAAVTMRAQAHLQLALYCLQHLHNIEDAGPSTLNRSSWKQEMPMLVVESVLEAMKLNNMTAHQYLPRLLQLIEVYPDTISCFQKKAAEIPPWMFLKWTSQIMALLDKPEAVAVQDIVVNLVNLYPQAMIYPFKLCEERFSFSNDASGKQRKAVVEKVYGSFSKMCVVNDFIEALNLLTSVECLFKDYYGSIISLKGQSKGNKQQVEEEVKKMWNEVVDFNDACSKYRCAISKEFKKKFEADFGKSGSKILSLPAKELQDKCMKLWNQMKESSQKLAQHSMLRDYSTWFESFALSHNDEELEIPGQYTGDQKPLVEYHAKVAGFDPKVLLLASIRMPKRIIIRGHDDREYRFLVKAGEDLRTDQRIEQLFGIMNQIYQDDPAYSSLDANIVTYQVIPLTLRLGLVEWVNDAVPLQDFLDGAVEKDKLKRAEDEVGKIFNELSKKAGGFQNCQSIYSASDEVVIKHHRRLKSVFPQDMIRQGLMQLSAGLETYLSLRNSFIISHAVLCISHYILGIGDRHLKNFMVAVKTGKLVGIDFGHCFGSATQFLPTPELMPFRFTNQLQRLLDPLGKANFSTPTMIHSLSALRAKPDILLNAMDVFIKKPTIDWQIFAKKQIAAGQATAEEMSSMSDLAWYPRQRIDYAKRKLEGGNPAYLTKDELTLGHSRNKSFKALTATCIGNKEKNERAQKPKVNLTAEEQVECLIDQATDENILGRTFVGWRPWL